MVGRVPRGSQLFKLSSGFSCRVSHRAKKLFRADMSRAGTGDQNSAGCQVFDPIRGQPCIRANRPGPLRLAFRQRRRIQKSKRVSNAETMEFLSRFQIDIRELTFRD